MNRQFATYSSDHNASAPREGRWYAGAASTPQPMTTAMTSSDAGINRSTRRAQKRARSIRPVPLSSRISSVVIRYPDSTKNTSTPTNPAVTPGTLTW